MGLLVRILSTSSLISITYFLYLLFANSNNPSPAKEISLLLGFILILASSCFSALLKERIKYSLATGILTDISIFLISLLVFPGVFHDPPISDLSMLDIAYKLFIVFLFCSFFTFIVSILSSATLKHSSRDE